MKIKMFTQKHPTWLIRAVKEGAIDLSKIRGEKVNDTKWAREAFMEKLERQYETPIAQLREDKFKGL